MTEQCSWIIEIASLWCSGNDSEVGKQRNRRTQIIITPKLDQFMDLIDKAPEDK